jgi:hypothetical protein
MRSYVGVDEYLPAIINSLRSRSRGYFDALPSPLPGGGWVGSEDEHPPTPPGGGGGESEDGHPPTPGGGWVWILPISMNPHTHPRKKLESRAQTSP